MYALGPNAVILAMTSHINTNVKNELAMNKSIVH